MKLKKGDKIQFVLDKELKQSGKWYWPFYESYILKNAIFEIINIIDENYIEVLIPYNSPKYNKDIKVGLNLKYHNFRKVNIFSLPDHLFEV